MDYSSKGEGFFIFTHADIWKLPQIYRLSTRISGNPSANMSADQTCYFSLISLLRFSIQKVMDRFAFDKDQVKGVVLKLSDCCSPKLDCKAQGVLRSGRSQSAKLLVVLSCVNMQSDVHQDMEHL